ncbi:PREDICTED: mas-related G-protein coupled receptor member X2-like [Propithecus coquereli]|uniref:mas-related G-protein coupled receptor member X2-like n=1 Tax=Propithecus coquereli TaxID=379532 RepID=UPI00063FA3AD|nr:PREDICTED: mas-related G-protein coupled receptor member X2-like [Propithecus coquereli]
MDPTIPAQSTELTPRNGSAEPPPITCYELALNPVLPVIIIALLGLLGNTVVFWLLGFRMRRNAFSVYILNLAGADFLLLCFLMIESLNKLIKVFHYPFFIPNVFHIVLTFSYLAGLYMLSTTSTERCLSVLWPIWQRWQEGQQTLQQVLQRALQDTPEVDERGGSLPQGSLELLESR